MQLCHYKLPTPRLSCFFMGFFALICLTSTVLGEPEKVADAPLDARNLAIQMLHLHPHLNFENYTLGYFQYENPLKYNSVLHDPIALSSALSDVSKKLSLKRENPNALPELVLNIVGETMKVQSGLRAEVSSILDSGTVSVENSEKAFKGFIPPSFFVLFPNAKLADNTQVTPEFADYINNRLVSQDRTPIYIRAYFRAVRFQQENVVQAYLSRVKFYSDPERTKLLEDRVENRSGPALIEKALLVDGLTLNSSPDHSTVINGEYMLEFFPAAAWTSSQCSPQKPERGHRVWLCKRKVPQSDGLAEERAEHRYVGGRLVQVSYFAVKSAPMIDLLGKKQMIAEQFGGKFNDKETTYRWQHQLTLYEVDFSMLKRGPKPYLQIRASEYQELLDGKPGYEPFL